MVGHSGTRREQLIMTGNLLVRSGDNLLILTSLLAATRARPSPVRTCKRLVLCRITEEVSGKFRAKMRCFQLA